MRNDDRLSANSTSSDLWPWFETAHDAIFAEPVRRRVRRIVIWLSLIGFILHLLCIFLARTFGAPPHWIAELGPNYLTAISTPFNFILFYEVLTLIAALPASTTRSIASQYEIVSLIFIRDVFRDITHAGDLLPGHHLSLESLPLFLDMWAGFFMFLFVAVFQHISLHRRSRSVTQITSRQTLRFIAQKKAVAAGLAVLLLAMAFWNCTKFLITLVRILQGAQLTLESATTFYNDVFTVMIFTDVLVLILSLIVSDRYDMVFRNAAFIASIVLIRVALTEGFPYGAPLALIAMLFGIATLLVFNYHLRNNGPVDA
jgi:hypothetical protein